MTNVDLQPMNTEQPKVDPKALEKVLSDTEFMETLTSMETPEKVQEALKSRGVDLSLTDVNVFGALINKMDEKGTTKLTQNDLNDIGGGLTGDEAKAMAKIVGKGALSIATFGVSNAVETVMAVNKVRNTYEVLRAAGEPAPKEREEEAVREVKLIGAASSTAAAVGSLAVVGATLALTKRKKIAKWFKNKFSRD